MKIYIRTKILLFSLFITVMTSCDLAPNLDDYEPLYSLPAEGAIYNESSAELALTGTYSVLQKNVYYSVLPSMLSGMDEGSFFIASGNADPEHMGYAKNNPVTDGTQLLDVYSTQYNLINRANWVIEKVGALKDTDFAIPARRNEIIAEAKTLRALGHFNLLRTFGYFYDMNSEYGIVIRLQPAKSKEVLPRSSVKESYAAIMDDLDSAIASAADAKPKYYVSKTFAKALKAKVLLYEGDYTQAAALAYDVIHNSGANYKLLPTYAGLFDHQSAEVFDNVSSLFNVYSDNDELIGLGFYWNGYFLNFSDTFAKQATEDTFNINGQKINYDATRVPFILTGAPLIAGLGNGNMKFRQMSGGRETLYILRIEEMYLIYAEADARSKKAVSSEALKAVNDIRVRAGATATGGDGFEVYPSTVTYAQFLELVRMEKRIELATENGEDWFDLVRYDYADGFGTGFQVSDVKATATNPNKFIMPFPYSSIQQGGGVIKQNPGY
ncbi:RagB/SusD family nutrient uptake outer membrane protein [Flavobacterium sp. FlaQc-48]|uniref:RagB/SusD family nutrient uptake outer membrane protein n=1 Tax=Flavobacterium sp. FlaQc-48 TaxID=3374181 RepID=UPI003756A75F